MPSPIMVEQLPELLCNEIAVLMPEDALSGAGGLGVSTPITLTIGNVRQEYLWVGAIRVPDSAKKGEPALISLRLVSTGGWLQCRDGAAEV